MAELSPLRRRMIEDMTVRNLSPATQRSYISAVAKFSRYFGRSPDRLTLDDVHAFQVHLVSTGIPWPSLNQIVCALRFTLRPILPRRFRVNPAATIAGVMIEGGGRGTPGRTHRSIGGAVLREPAWWRRDRRSTKPRVDIPMALGRDQP